jgi:DNA polymerase-4
VTLKMRYSDFSTITRAPLRARHARRRRRSSIGRCGLVDKTDAGRTPVRLIGVSVSGLGDETSPSRRAQAVAEAHDSVRA